MNQPIDYDKIISLIDGVRPYAISNFIGSFNFDAGKETEVRDTLSLFLTQFKNYVTGLKAGTQLTASTEIKDLKKVSMKTPEGILYSQFKYLFTKNYEFFSEDEIQIMNDVLEAFYDNNSAVFENVMLTENAIGCIRTKFDNYQFYSPVMYDKMKPFIQFVTTQSYPYNESQQKKIRRLFQEANVFGEIEVMEAGGLRTEYLEKVLFNRILEETYQTLLNECDTAPKSRTDIDPFVYNQMLLYFKQYEFPQIDNERIITKILPGIQKKIDKEQQEADDLQIQIDAVDLQIQSNPAPQILQQLTQDKDSYEKDLEKKQKLIERWEKIKSVFTEEISSKRFFYNLYTYPYIRQYVENLFVDYKSFIYFPRFENGAFAGVGVFDLETEVNADVLYELLAQFINYDQSQEFKDEVKGYADEVKKRIDKVTEVYKKLY